MALLLERQWTRQPQTQAGIDWSNPITRGLTILAHPLGYNAARGLPAVSLTVARQPSRAGQALQFAGGTEVARWDSQQVTPGGYTALTLLVPGFSSASNTRQGIWHWADAATFGSGADVDRLRMIWLDSSNGFYLDVKGGYAYRATPSFSAGDALLLGFSKGSDNSGQFWLNGSALSTTVVAYNLEVGTPAAAVPLWLGDDVEASGRRLNGGIVLHAHWPRVLSASEHARLAANPWQLFAPQRVVIPLSTAPAPTLFGTLGQFDPELRLSAWF